MDKENKKPSASGDMPNEEFRNLAHKMSDFIADYLKNIEDYPVLSKVKPGDIKQQIPKSPPLKKEPTGQMFDDIEKIIMPGVTHWNHPNFHAYFNSTSSGPAILAEMLSAALNVNGMIWKTGPSATELEEVTLEWLRESLGIPDNFKGITYDTASVSSMHAMAAARENIPGLNIREKGMTGRSDLPALRIYSSEHAHSSIEKGALTLGIGLDNIVKIPVDNEYKMVPQKLEEAIKNDRAQGFIPMCVIGTIGTTSTTSIDPIEEIGKICKEGNIWFHVDAAHAGSAAILSEYRYIFKGVELADSIVVNPHKWMFLPVDLSVLYTTKPSVLKRAFSLTPEYLKTKEDAVVTNYSDYGIQLGRRFRSLKLWFNFKYFGVEGLAAIIRENVRLGKMFERWIDNHEIFNKTAPAPFSTVCFRAEPHNITPVKYNELNSQLMERINATGKVFISHTVLNGKFTLRFVVSSLRTEERHVKNAIDIIDNELKQILESYNE